ncbi:helix-turn-helix transcriptional regulator [bacterium]|nr:helix-turn-helix transcriptional regulator [bacterium]MBQ9246921.1 helix-turn-helix transcriptional regulator [bacterium]
MDDIKKLLGQRIRELRKRKKYTQEKLAEIIGIEPRNLLKIENAQTFPRAQTLQKLLETLECTPNELFNCEHMNSTDYMRKKVLERIKTDDELVKLIYKIIM